ncbi:hypothetical protein Ndes2437A_g09149 [Nannochloris sp. 'desiccata']
MPKNTGIQESKPVEGPFSGMYIHQIKSQSLVLFGFKTGRDPLWSYCRDMWATQLRRQGSTSCSRLQLASCCSHSWLDHQVNAAAAAVQRAKWSFLCVSETIDPRSFLGSFRVLFRVF